MPSKSPNHPPRALHLIDLENLVGSDACTADAAALAYRAYVQSVPQSPFDQYILATSHHNVLAMASWPHGRRLVRSGPNGAEIELCEAANELDVAAKFSSIVVASGDHYFAAPVKEWKASGLYVTVVGVQKQVSHLLYKVAHRYIGLPNIALPQRAAPRTVHIPCPRVGEHPA